MALTPGGGRSPSAQPPPPENATPPAPPRRPRDSALAPRMGWATALTAVVRWATLIGGLIIIVDLGTTAIMQRAGGPEAVSDLGAANSVSNVVLFSILGIVVARQTGMFLLSGLAGLLAALLDGVIVVIASSMAPIPNVPAAPPGEYLVYNVLVGAIPALFSGFIATLADRFFGPRSR